MFVGQTLMQLIPTIPPEREKLLDLYAQRFSDASIGFETASVMATQAVEVITRIPVAALRPKLTEESFNGLGRLVETANQLQKHFDSCAEIEVLAALRFARRARNDREFDSSARAAELVLSRYKGMVSECRLLVGRLAIQLDILNAAGNGIFSDTFMVTPAVPGAHIAGVV